MSISDRYSKQVTADWQPWEFERILMFIQLGTYKHTYRVHFNVYWNTMLV